MANYVSKTGKNYSSDDGYTVQYDDRGFAKGIFDANGNKVDDYKTSETDEDYSTRLANEEAQAQAAKKREQNRIAFKQGLRDAGRSFASTAQAALKPQPVSNPQAQHNARQAALAENQAAKLRAQQQQANQIANRTSTTTGAMNEAQKVAEQSALQKQRLASQQMVGDAGLANAAAAKAGAEVDPGQHFSEMQALGSQERQRAISLGEQQAAMQSTAEAQRAKTTAEVEEKQQVAQRNAQAEAASQAAAARQASQDALNEGLVQSQIARNKAEGEKLTSEGQKLTTEGQKTNIENVKASEPKVQAFENEIRALLKDPTDAPTIMHKYIALHNLDNKAGNAIMAEISKAIGPQSAHKDIGEKALEYWKAGNPEAKPETVAYMTTQLSDKRMKTIETPVGHALMNIWKGRTM